MTSRKLYQLLRKCGWETDPASVFHKIWGQPFDGETEKITKKDEVNTTKSASSTSAATDESSAADHFCDATKMVNGESSEPTPTQPNP